MRNTIKFLGIIAFSAIIAFTMSTCDDGKTLNTNPCVNGHIPGVAATCVTLQTCIICGYILQEANGHTPGIAAACETAQTCTVCSYVIKAATGHNWGDWEEDSISATCTSASKDTASCLNQNCAITDERTGSHSALGHNLPGAKAATCVATGLTGIGHCNRCNEDLTGDVIPIDSENHDFGDWTQKTAATCISPERLIRVCSYIATHTEEEYTGEIDTAAHDWDWTLNVIAATCVQVSKDTATCNNIPCTETNEREGDNPALGHLGNWVITTPPNFSAETDGEETRTCSTCTTYDTRVYKFYKIGNTGPAGGIIFYVVTSGFTVTGYGDPGNTGYFATYTAYYLEAAPANETKSRWQTASSSDNTLIAGTTTWANPTEKNAGLAASIGVGRKDTQTIVNSTAFAALTDTAAQRCANKDLNGFTDWFLPSLGELNEMFRARVAGVTGIPITGWFWSSSQANNSGAWDQIFDSGTQGYSSKINSSDVRAVRAF